MTINYLKETFIENTLLYLITVIVEKPLPKKQSLVSKVSSRKSKTLKSFILTENCR